MAVGAFNNNGSTNLKTADGDGSINAPYIPSVAVNGMAAAAAAADNTANPTTTSVIAFGMVYDGATWDRMPGTAADGVLVNLGTNNDVTVASIAAGSTIIGGTRDAGPSWTVVRGVAGVVFGSTDATTAAAVTDAPTSGQKLVITDLIVTNASASDLVLTFHEESTAATTIAVVALKAGTSQQFTPRGRWKLPTADKKLMVDASAAGQIYVEAQYFSEA